MPLRGASFMVTFKIALKPLFLLLDDRQHCKVPGHAGLVSFVVMMERRCGTVIAAKPLVNRDLISFEQCASL